MALVLAPELPLDRWLADFDALLARSPAYFINKPVVVDVSGLPQKRPDIMGVLNELLVRKVRVMALEGTDTGTLGADARGLPPILSDNRPSAPIDVPTEARPADETAVGEARAEAETAEPPACPVPAMPPAPRSQNSMVIERPIRSGQAIYCPDGDVTVLGSVASGAEIIAGGSIHIYGTLRGRALAGWGNKEGRIFCRNLDAELLAIDGLYKTADEIDVNLRGRPIHAWTRGDVLVIEALG